MNVTAGPCEGLIIVMLDDARLAVRIGVIGGRRFTPLTIASWASVLLPVSAILESGLFFTMSYWWFLFPAQFVVGGVLGIFVAFSKRRWWWFCAAWGVTATLWGVLWIATATFWAR
jgi:hypothetical protein